MDNRESILDPNRAHAGNAEAGLVAGEQYGRKVVGLTAEIKDHRDGRPYRIKPNGEIEIVERLAGQPTFRRGEASHIEALSFARFVKRFRNSTSVIFADRSITAPKFTAILDYHPAGEEQVGAQWDLFRAILPLTFTASWQTWAQANGKAMAQADFAQFLEDNIPDISEPSGATLVEIARKLEAAVDVQWKSHLRADNGAHNLTWVETVNGSATTESGKVTIPKEILLELQPFEGSKTYAVTARFRYRIIQGKVSMWFDLVRLQDVLRDAFNDELMKIDTEVNGGPSGDRTASEADTILTPIYNGPVPQALKPGDL